MLVFDVFSLIRHLLNIYHSRLRRFYPFTTHTALPSATLPYTPPPQHTHAKFLYLAESSQWMTLGCLSIGPEAIVSPGRN